MRSFLACIGLFISIFSFAQSVKWSAVVNKTVEKGAVFEVEFKLENAGGSNFIAPEFNGLKVLSGPGVSNSISIVNGRRSQTYSLVYRVLAQDLGLKKIGSASITANGKTFKTEPVLIEVVEGKDIGQLLGANDFLLVPELSDSVAYVGQQIKLDYRLYYQGEVRIGDVVSLDQFNGFYTRGLSSNKDSKTISQNGKVYNSVVVRSFALFPQKSGEFKIDPLVLAIGVPNGQRVGRGFFSFGSYDSYQVSSAPVRLDVINIPNPIPDAFTGGVGEYTFNASINTKETTTDDAVVMTINIKGNGDGRLLQAPKVPSLTQWEVYEPSVTNDSEGLEGDQFVFVKTFEYIMLPKAMGQLKVAPEFSYFNVDSNRYITFKISPAYVDVKSGNRKVLDDGSKIGLDRTIAALKPKGSGTSSSLGIATPWYLGSVGGLLGILGLMYVKKKSEEDYNALSPEERRRLEAQKVAEKHLTEAKGLLAEATRRSFFENLSTALNGYVADKYNIDHSTISKQLLAQKIKEAYPSSSIAEDYYKLLSNCEMALFAGQSVDMESAYREAVEIIAEISK